MKITKKCKSTQYKINNQLDKRRNKRRSSAGLFNTSSAGAVTSLILMILFSFTGATSIYADSINLSVSTDNLTIDVAPLSSAGEFTKSGNMNISVSTTGESGYTLSIASSTGSTDLKSSQNTIGSISAAIDESTFSNSANTQYNNKWGYKPSNLYNSSTEQIVTNTNFRPLPGTSGEIIAKTACANGTSPCTSATDNYSLSIAARTTITTPIGDYVSDTFVIAAVANRVPLSCDSTKLCIEYDGNGLTYNGSPINRVNYDSSTTQAEVTEYAHSSNFEDGSDTPTSYYYAEETSTPVTISGASSIDVSLKYGLGYDGDALAIVKGSYTDLDVYGMMEAIRYACGASDLSCIESFYNDNYGVSLDIIAAYDSSSSTTTPDTATLSNIASDSVTFVFYGYFPDWYGEEAYGYYAEVSGMSTTYSRPVSSGEYAEPTGANASFYGWSTTQITSGGGLPSQVEYVNNSEVLARILGDNGDTDVLYAVWQQGWPITFTKDSKVTSIVVLNEDGSTVGTITESGQSLVLYQGNTYKVKPSYTSGYGYATNTITKTTGTGTLNGRQFAVGAGVATINVVGNVLLPMQNFDCSSLSQGNVEEVYDARDDEVYLIGKLADSKCWMLDNLRLDLTNSVVLNGLTVDNTHVNADALTSLRSGNRSANNKYATAGFSGSNWTSGYSYSVPMVNVSGIFDGNPYTKDSIVTSYGEGSGKIGVYYNYCAASAGSYCYGNGISPGTSSGNAEYDLCPVGWRMPTGGLSGEYDTLYDHYNTTQTATDTASLQYNLSTPLSGNLYDGSVIDQGDNGLFWSSTRFDNGHMHYLYVDSGSVYSTDMNNRYGGYSIRCVSGS